MPPTPRDPTDPTTTAPNDAPLPPGAEFRAAVPRRGRGVPTAVALAAGAILAVAVLTREIPLPNADPSATPVPATTAPTALAAAITPGTPAPTALVVPARNPNASPHPTIEPVPAEAGSTALRPAGADADSTTRLTLTVPDGWQRVGDHMVVKDGGTAPGGVSLSTWHLRTVFYLPCRWTSLLAADPSLMATAEGQAVALSRWWGQDAGRPPRSNVAIAPVSTRPEPTDFAGEPAWQVGMLVLSGFDMTACDADQLVFWETPAGDVRYGLGPGELHQMWVVDVDGEIIVIDAASFHGTSAADVEELEGIIGSIAVER